MCLLNHYSAQTEISEINSPETEATSILNYKILLKSFLLLTVILITLFLEVPAIFSQEEIDSDIVQTFDEDPLAESDSELGLDKDPLLENDPELGIDEDPLTASDKEIATDEATRVEKSTEFPSEEIILNDASPELGIERDPLVESNMEQVFEENQFKKAIPENVFAKDLTPENDPELGLDEDPISGESADTDQEVIIEYEEDRPEGDGQFLEEEEFNVKVNFSHKVKTLLGASETIGLSVLEPLLSEIKEIRFVSTYDQSVKINTSPRMYNFFRLSISFSQNYEVNKKRLFDGYATLREIYSNYRTGPHQLRYGAQIFNLGKVDLDNVIDVLHMNNVMGLYTFDPDDTKDSLTSIRYNWFRGSHTATMYLAPIRQQSFGMRFTEFREGVEEQETDSEDSRVSFLRDYYGLQYQWTGDIVDTRLGLFHWFDSNPYIKFEYEGASETDSAAVQESFENMLGNYTEKETRSDFVTFELDAIWTDLVWKLESGIFKKRNFYSYEVPQERQVKLSTFQAPHFAFATSFERTFPYFYWLMIYSHRKTYDVPENTHVFLYENEDSLILKTRDVERNQVSGVAVLKTPDNSLRITLLNYRTWPFVQKGFASLFTWEHYKENLELELKFFSLKTDRQKMLNDQIATNQVFLTYTQKFAAN